MGLFSSKWANERRETRALMSQLQAIGGIKGGYWAALGSALKHPRATGNHSENAIDPSQFPLLSSGAWDRYRIDPHFRKIVRSLSAKVIGHGLMPNSQARRPNGEPFEEFRARAKQLWEDCHGAIDWHGKPGQGGETLVGLELLAFRTVLLSGEQLFTLRPLNGAEQVARGLPVPLAIQLIDPQRMAEDAAATLIEDGHVYYRGIELDADRVRYRYWINDYMTGSVNVSELQVQPKPYSAARIYHVYLKEDDDQLRGTTWFAAALMPARHGSDLRYNVVKSSAMQACVVLSYTLAAGKSKFGKTPSDASNLTDADGNALTHFSPGMCINKGKEGNVEMHSPNINISGYDGLIASVSRDEAAAVPGTKSSTVTGDYRNSSFSSERSADNDAWPEIEVVQEWFSSQFCQPIYEAIVTAGVAEGYFDGIPGFSVEAFNRNRASFLRCKWQGPVARSINPVDDENASELRLRGGRSSPQRECAKNGVVFDEVLDEIVEAREKIKQRGLPEVVFNSIMGLDSKDLLSTAETAASTANGGANVAEKQTT